MIQNENKRDTLSKFRPTKINAHKHPKLQYHRKMCCCSMKFLFLAHTGFFSATVDCSYDCSTIKSSSGKSVECQQVCEQIAKEGTCKDEECVHAKMDDHYACYFPNIQIRERARETYAPTFSDDDSSSDELMSEEFKSLDKENANMVLDKLTEPQILSSDANKKKDKYSKRVSDDASQNSENEDSLTGDGSSIRRHGSSRLEDLDQHENFFNTTGLAGKLLKLGISEATKSAQGGALASLAVTAIFFGVIAAFIASVYFFLSFGETSEHPPGNWADSLEADRQ